MQAVRKLVLSLLTVPLLVLLPIVVLCLVWMIASIMLGYVPKPLVKWASTRS
jgi:hypothetical protein